MYSAVYKVLSLLEHSCAILISFKIVVIFNITSADFVLILKEMRIAQLCSKSERTLVSTLQIGKVLNQVSIFDVRSTSNSNKCVELGDVFNLLLSFECDVLFYAKLCNQVRSLSPFRSSDLGLENIQTGFVTLLEFLLRKSIINISQNIFFSL